MISLIFLSFGLAVQTPSHDVHGIWVTDAGGHIQLDACASDETKLCGALIDAPELRTNPELTDGRNPDEALRSRPLRGVLIVDGFEPNGDEWRAGQIYDPEEGVVVTRGRLRHVEDDLVELRGCVAMFCRTVRWTRLPDAEQR